jgi:hypothetical protein
MKSAIQLAALALGLVSSPALSFAGFLPSGTVLEQHSVAYSSSAGKFTGVLTYAVYQESGTNHLDFLFQVNPNNGLDPNERITVTDFIGAKILAVQQENSDANLPSLFAQLGGIAPTSFSITSGGANVSWNFDNPISTGSHSTILEVFTDATSYGQGFTNIIDGDIARVASFAPTPEPAGLTMLLIGMAGAGLYSWRRRPLAA